MEKVPLGAWKTNEACYQLDAFQVALLNNIWPVDPLEIWICASSEH